MLPGLSRSRARWRACQDQRTICPREASWGPHMLCVETISTEAWRTVSTKHDKHAESLYVRVLPLLCCAPWASFLAPCLPGLKLPRRPPCAPATIPAAESYM